MEIINDAIYNLKNTNSDQYNIFYTAFKNIFPLSQLQSLTSGGIKKNMQYGGYPPYVNNAIKTPDTSQLAYYITIDLQLHPGTSITPEAKKMLNCNHKWNAIKKSYSQFVGKPYNITPDYSLLLPPKKVPPPNSKNYGGKRRKTVKRKYLKTKKVNKTITHNKTRRHYKTRKQYK